MNSRQRELIFTGRFRHLSGMRFFASLRMTGREGLAMTMPKAKHNCRRSLTMPRGIFYRDAYPKKGQSPFGDSPSGMADRWFDTRLFENESRKSAGAKRAEY